jgi:tetratricopeptide (TPR) repeat protein
MQTRLAALVVTAVAASGVAVASLLATPPVRQPRLPDAATGTHAAATDPLATSIRRTQLHLRDVPRDWQAWATLGFDYVEQAKVTVDPSYYPKAEAALARSLSLDDSDNFVAMAGEAALSAARHDFHGALRWARRGLVIDPRNAVLHGALCDALTQLGRYRAAEAAARAMELLRPGSDAAARLSYAAELRGDLVAARAFMTQALVDAVSPADVAFARYYLGEIALSAGDAHAALADATAGLIQAPTSAMLLEGKARDEAALGMTAAAVRDLAQAVARVPQPSYVLEYAELLQSLGDDAGARRQLAVFRAEEQLFRANGVTLDTDEILFEADHGSPAVAVSVARAALRTRPFLETWDAYAWALHRTGRDRWALAASNHALATGMRNALFRYHRGVIEHSLGDDVAARRDLRGALRVNPRFDPLRAPMARRLLDRIEGVR